MVTQSPNPLAVVKLSWETIKPTYGQNRYEPPYDPDNRYEHAGDGIIASTILLSVDTSVGGAETMSIMSVSLPDPLVQQMDTLTKERGFAGRSDFVRAAVREFVQQLVSDPMRSGRRSATITLLYPEELERRVAEVAHDQSKVITSMMHANAGRGRCVTVYIVEGDAEAIQRLTVRF
ncbi:MAG: CopG family ribbon-helix-helix protein, partial [Methanobacteriota archaeon]